MRKIVLCIFAVICLLGGIMGLLKAVIPQVDWLSFRYILHMGATYNHMEYPVYARVYGGMMAVMELGIAAVILLWKKKLFYICIIGLVINILGCVVAICLGDIFAIVSLFLRLIPLLIIRKEIKGKTGME